MFEWLPWRRKVETPTTPQTRGYYAGAQINRFAQWGNVLESADKEIKRDLVKLREHARDLTKNNAFARRYVDLVATHLVGADGIKFESAILGNKNRPKENWNLQIQNAWAEWGKKPSLDGCLSWIDLQQLVAQTVAGDGEVLVRLHRGAGRYGLSLEVLDADLLDHTFNALGASTRVVMGVEQELTTGRPIAYHLWTQHPTDQTSRERVRIPAREILHVHRKDRARASRGVSWLSPVMLQLSMLGRYWTAELAAANAEADRLAFLVGKDDGLGVVGDPTTFEIQSDHATFIPLPPGVDVNVPALQHPAGAFGDFTRALLKGIAAGLGVAYHTLSADVSDANYSSARVALLEERDQWRKLQTWFIGSFCVPVFEAWLEMALLSGELRIPTASFDQLNAPRWWPRTWEWVDPEKDARASILAIESGLSTYQAELGSLGMDWRETFTQAATEKEFAASLGLVFTTPNAVPPAATPATPEPTPGAPANG